VDIYQVIKEPHITEKGNLQKELYNQISLKVHKRANKIEIRRAGKKADWKKAIVTLAPGESVEFFEGV